MAINPSSGAAFCQRVTDLTHVRLETVARDLLRYPELTPPCFDKISWTLIDSRVFVDVLDTVIQPLLDYYTIVRCLNGFVYRLDNLSESGRNVPESSGEFRSNVLDACIRCAETTFARDRIVDAIATWMNEHLDFVTREVMAQEAILNRSSLDDKYFRALFEVTDQEYIDLGFYGRLLQMWLSSTDTGELSGAVWGVRCRVMDIVDALADVDEDIAARKVCPFGMYVYSVGNDDERRRFVEAFESHNPGELLSLMRPYSGRLINHYRHVIEVVPSEVQNYRGAMRVADILDRTQEFVLGRTEVSDLDRFYLETTVTMQF